MSEPQTPQTIAQWQEEIVTWAMETFGPSTFARVMRHVREEIDEIEMSVRSEDLGEEIADCLFLLLRLADMHAVDLQAAMRRKFVINRARAWGPADEHGVIRHAGSTRMG